jgi:hypothetical protein
MTCKFCLGDYKCIEAHIIPNSLYKPLLADPSGMLIVSNKSEIHPKRSHTGIYDSELVCEKCERLFSKFDDYAQSFFSAEIPDNNYIIHKNEKLAYFIEDVDYPKLKLFFISLLWRASVTNHPFFSKVDVGPFEVQLKKMITGDDPGDENTFSVTITKYDETSLASAMLSPHRNKWCDINYYTFYLRGFKVYIKVDQRIAPDIMLNFMIRPHNRLLIPLLEFRKSSEIKVMEKMAKIYDEKFSKRKSIN